jgi:hypothetical protein
MTKKKPTPPVDAVVQEPVFESSRYNSDKDRFQMDCDLTKHYFFSTADDFENVMTHDYRTSPIDGNVEKAVEIVGKNFISILREVYAEEAFYWQQILSGCKRENSCVECIVTKEAFLNRQLDTLTSFVDIFTLFYSYYDYSYDEISVFKHAIVANRDFTSEVIKIKKDIKKICMKDSPCVKRKMFRILERLHSFIQAIENGIDEAVTNLRETLPNIDDKKLFTKKRPLISIEEMRSMDIVRIIDNSSPDNFLSDFRESFELHEEQMRS